MGHRDKDETLELADLRSETNFPALYFIARNDAEAVKQAEQIMLLLEAQSNTLH